MTPCIFCQILADELPASIVYRDEEVIAFMDIQPINPGHVLVVPRVHAQSLEDLPSDVAEQLMTVARRVMRGLRKTDLRCEGINLFLADGAAAGQEVAHVHLHVIPRFVNDGFGLRFPPDYGEPSSREELDDFAAAIRQAVS